MGHIHQGKFQLNKDRPVAEQKTFTGPSQNKTEKSVIVHRKCIPDKPLLQCRRRVNCQHDVVFEDCVAMC